MLSLAVESRYTWAETCADRCGNFICEPDIGEDCVSCPTDCAGLQGVGTWQCPNDICEIDLGEDCHDCPEDCNNMLGGNPDLRYCCGEGVQYGIGCSDARCSVDNQCTQRFCCGDGAGINPVGCSDTDCSVAPRSCETTGPPCDCRNRACDEAGSPGIDLGIACGSSAVTITPVDCGAPPISIARSLLRVAIRCFVSASAEEEDHLQAQYSDSFDFARTGAGGFNASDELTVTVQDCEAGEYLASAQWIMDSTVVQTQCSGGGLAVPECFPATKAELAEISASLTPYAAILPAVGPSSCFLFADISTAELRNSSITSAYQGVMAGRYVCSTNASPAAAVSVCDGLSDGERPDLGTYGKVVGFNLAPEAYVFAHVNPGQGFDWCCDHDIVAEDSGCATNLSLCSPVDLECTNAAILAICTAGTSACSQPGAPFKLLDRAIWLDPKLDVEPGHSSVRPSAFADACFKFSFNETLLTPDDHETVPFVFKPAAPPAPASDDCILFTGDSTDEDFDGIYDRCDPVVAHVGPADGVQTLLIRNKVRNEGFFGDFEPATDTVTIGTEPATIVTSQSSASVLTVVVPPIAGTAPQTITVTPDDPPPAPEAFGDAAQDFLPRTYGYVADQTADGLLVFDSIDERIRDGNASKSNSYINLNCNPANGYTTVAPPRDLAVRRVATGLPPPAPPEADREVFTLSDMTFGNPPQQAGRLFAIDVQTHRLRADLPNGGVPLAGSGRALDVARDTANIWRGYVARKLGEDSGTISVVNVDPSVNVVGDLLWSVKETSSLELDGIPLGLRTQKIGGTVRAYVTSVLCSNSPYPPGGGLGPLGPICIECGGGLQYRHFFLSVVDATNPLAMTATSHALFSEAYGCSGSEGAAADLVNLGMDFSLDGDKLFVANPGEGLVEVVYTNPATTPVGCVVNEPCDFIDAGAWPTDVAVVMTAGESGEERLYVADRYDQFVSVYSVASLAWITSIDLKFVGPDEPDLALPVLPVAIAARSDGRRLFVACSDHRTVKVVNVDPGTPLIENKVVRSMTTAGPARRLVLLDVP